MRINTCGFVVGVLGLLATTSLAADDTVDLGIHKSNDQRVAVSPRTTAPSSALPVELANLFDAPPPIVTKPVTKRLTVTHKARPPRFG